MSFEAHAYQVTSPIMMANLLSKNCEASIFGKNVDKTEEVLKKSLSSDIGKFCEETAWGGVEYNFWDLEGESVAGIKKEMLENRKEKIEGKYPWQLSLVPHMKYRGEIFDNCGIKFAYCRQTSEMREEIQKKRDQNGPADMNVWSHDRTAEAFDVGLASSSLVRSAVCTDVTVMSAGDCGEALGNIIEYAKPTSYGGTDFTAAPSYVELFTNKKYIAGLRRASLLILDRFEKRKVPEGANLFEDIRDSYKQEGMNSKDAEDATWEVMAVLASGGPNILTRLNKFDAGEEFETLKWSLSAIALALPKLDLVTTEKGHPYSMPKSVTTTCDIGKPYHFWMTAYLARRMKLKNGHSSMGAASAAYLSQKGYEIKSTTIGRDPNRAFTTEAFGSWNNIMRVDTAFSSAAAIYGANAADGHETELNIDEGLKVIIESGKILPKLSKAESEELWSKQFGRKAYNRWQEIIGSDNAFEFHSEKLK